MRAEARMEEQAVAEESDNQRKQRDVGQRSCLSAGERGEQRGNNRDRPAIGEDQRHALRRWRAFRGLR